MLLYRATIHISSTFFLSQFALMVLLSRSISYTYERKSVRIPTIWKMKFFGPKLLFFKSIWNGFFFLNNVFVAFVVPDTCYLLLLKHYYLQLSVIDNLFLIFRAFWHKLLDFLDSIYHIDWSTFWMVFTSYLFLLLFLE